MKADRRGSLESLDSYRVDEPDELFPAAVRPRVFQWLWVVLVVLVVALGGLIVEYGRIAGQ